MIKSQNGRVQMAGFEGELKQDLAVIIRAFWEGKVIKSEEDLKEILQMGRDAYIRNYKEKTIEKITIDAKELWRQMKNGKDAD